MFCLDLVQICPFILHTDLFFYCGFYFFFTLIIIKIYLFYNHFQIILLPLVLGELTFLSIEYANYSSVINVFLQFIYFYGELLCALLPLHKFVRVPHLEYVNVVRNWFHVFFYLGPGGFILCIHFFYIYFMLFIFKYINFLSWDSTKLEHYHLKSPRFAECSPMMSCRYHFFSYPQSQMGDFIAEFLGSGKGFLFPFSWSEQPLILCKGLHFSSLPFLDSKLHLLFPGGC